MKALKIWVSDYDLYQISFIGLVSTKDYYKRPSGVVYEKVHIDVSF